MFHYFSNVAKIILLMTFYDVLYRLLSESGSLWSIDYGQTIVYSRGDSMIFKKVEKVVGLQQPADRDYVLSIE